MMKIRNKFQNLLLQEDMNFLLTNRIPRITLTRFMGWWSQLRNPLIVNASIAVWRWFTDLDLTEAKQQKFASLHECFTRELRPGLRPIDPRPEILSSPCDCIVGACGEIRDGMVFQAKGFPYTLASLLSSPDLVQHWPSVLEGGTFVTMRLTSSMYHRFHAPCDAHLSHVTYLGRHLERQPHCLDPCKRVVLQKRACGVANDNGRRRTIFDRARGRCVGGQHAFSCGGCAAEPTLQRLE
jgi:phosphatidylserine decarboxylase